MAIWIFCVKPFNTLNTLSSIPKDQILNSTCRMLCALRQLIRHVRVLQYTLCWITKLSTCAHKQPSEYKWSHPLQFFTVLNTQTCVTQGLLPSILTAEVPLVGNTLYLLQWKRPETPTCSSNLQIFTKRVSKGTISLYWNRSCYLMALDYDSCT